MLFERKNATNGVFGSMPMPRQLAIVYGEERIYVALALALEGREVEKRICIGRVKGVGGRCRSEKGYFAAWEWGVRY